MCGIVGFTGKQNRRLLGDLLKEVQHRGYDDTALYYSSGINLGMNRLAILDLSKNLYPMKYKNYILVYNGEIYNYRKLKRKLQAKGVTFKTKSDAEVILPLFDIYGPSFLSMLEGMFAICIFDKKNKSLILARDKSGEKPLYYYQQNKIIVFASEIKAIVSYLTKVYLNKDTLPAYLSHGSIYGNDTLVEGIKKVGPSQFYTFDLHDTESFGRKYWSPRISTVHAKEEIEVLKKRLSYLIENSVNSRLVSDVPVGSFLSGGVDSSLIAFFASKKLPRLNTFSISFPNSLRHDESRYARKVAKFIGSDHFEISCTAKKCRTIFENIGRYIDEPIVDPAVLPTFLLAEEARKRVKVVLTGEGADELFGGYYWYQKEIITSALKRSYLGSKLIEVGNTLGLQNKLGDLNASLPDRYSPQNVWSKYELNSLLKYSFDLKGANIMPQKLTTDLLTAMQIADYRGYLAEQLLMKIDKMTMIHNLEARAPYLDSKIISFAFNLSHGMKQNGIFGKYLLRKVAEEFLPHSIAWRLKKGFSLPLGSWFRDELKDVTIFGLEIMKKYESVFDVDNYQEIIKQHLTGKANHVNKIFSITVLMSWLDYHKVKIE